VLPPRANLPIGLEALAKTSAWREMSFWTSTSLFTPLLEAFLLAATLPTYSDALQVLWDAKRVNRRSWSVLLLLPLNLVALLLSKQLATQLLGLAGLLLAGYQLTVLRALNRASQQRL